MVGITRGHVEIEGHAPVAVRAERDAADHRKAELAPRQERANCIQLAGEIHGRIVARPQGLTQRLDGS